ncbi:FMN-binding protein [Streptomyces sp. HPF1205]|uniref:FMN-binding protein n=1 Tax=Streptomyces sp. HPF1205 TaxID=2873262 RepID=UPI001CED2AE4|nr:FMN-binding protein [Streptomyces sp. HPF1205]
MHGRPARRVVLSTGATVAGVVVLLSLKPHTTGGTTAAAVPAPSSTATAGTGSSTGGSSDGRASGGSTPSGGSSGSSKGGTSTSGSSKSGSSKSGSSRSGGSGGGSAATRTVNGDTVQTRYGPVQLRITLTGGKLTKVTALQLPSDNPRDQEIAGFAVPQLTQEALAAQSAHIDAVSGATYTSAGYTQSLQSALDKAGL